LKKGQRVAFAAGIGHDQQLFARQVVPAAVFSLWQLCLV
jgi:hypothetical protein